VEKKTYSESKVQKLLNRYRKEVTLQNKGNTLWTLYNTITNYSTHVDNVDWTGNTVDESGNVVQASLGGAKHNIMYNRELEVAKSLKHPLFQLAS
jgi:putative aminopeptidase FrvX